MVCPRGKDCAVELSCEAVLWVHRQVLSWKKGTSLSIDATLLRRCSLPGSAVVACLAPPLWPAWLRCSSLPGVRSPPLRSWQEHTVTTTICLAPGPRFNTVQHHQARLKSVHGASCHASSAIIPRGPWTTALVLQTRPSTGNSSSPFCRAFCRG